MENLFNLKDLSHKIVLELEGLLQIWPLIHLDSLDIEEIINM